MLSVLSGRQGDSKPVAVSRDYNAFLWTRYFQNHGGESNSQPTLLYYYYSKDHCFMHYNSKKMLRLSLVQLIYRLMCCI